MANKLLVTTGVAVVLAMGGTAYAQSKKSDMFLAPSAEAGFASQLIGATVYDRSGNDAQSIGEINDLIVEEDGSIPAVILGVGGFLGVGEKDVAVSFDALQMTTDGDGDRYVILETTKEDLQAAPDFDYDMAMAPAAVTTEKATPDLDQALSDKAAEATKDPSSVDRRVVGPDREGLRVAEAGSFSTEKLVGVTVYSADNENIGEVSDVIITQKGDKGAIDAVILDVGGFLGIGEKPVAVAFESLEIMTDEDGTLYAYSKFTEDQLEAAAEYDAETYEMNRETMLVRPQA